MKSLQTSRRALDKRVQSTHQRLVRSLRALMTQTPYENISVAQICTVANVSRSSFYAHFEGKQALLELSLEHLSQELREASASARSIDTGARFEFLPGFLQHVQEHQAIYLENRYSNTAQSIEKNMRMLLQGLIQRELNASQTNSGVDATTVLFAIGGTYAVIEQWLEQKCREPFDQKLAELDRLLSNGLALNGVKRHQ